MQTKNISSFNRNKNLSKFNLHFKRENKIKVKKYFALVLHVKQKLMLR